MSMKSTWYKTEDGSTPQEKAYTEIETTDVSCTNSQTAANAALYQASMDFDANCKESGIPRRHEVAVELLKAYASYYINDKNKFLPRDTNQADEALRLALKQIKKEVRDRYPSLEK